ncbi:MAG: hypothetical protein V5A62_07635 [Haloarculaceae archaeon]
MTRILVDATTLIALGNADRLDLLTCFDGRLPLHGAVTAEVTTQPAKENLRQFRADQGLAELGPPAPDWMERARKLLGEDGDNGDVVLVRRLDSGGLHMTGELREKADELIEDPTRENGGED